MIVSLIVFMLLYFLFLVINTAPQTSPLVQSIHHPRTQYIQQDSHYSVSGGSDADTPRTARHRGELVTRTTNQYTEEVLSHSRTNGSSSDIRKTMKAAKIQRDVVSLASMHDNILSIKILIVITYLTISTALL